MWVKEEEIGGKTLEDEQRLYRPIGWLQIISCLFDGKENEFWRICNFEVNWRCGEGVKCCGF